MKKLFMTMAVAAATLSASAQDVTFGVRAGMNIATVSVSSDYGTFDSDAHVGFNVGAIANIDLGSNFGIEPGVYLTQKGYKIGGLNSTPLYIEVPVLCTYTFNLNSNLDLQINAGPYFAFGVAGKEKYANYEADFFGDDAYKRFDAGLKTGVGLTFNKNYYVGVSYEFGFVNIDRTNTGSLHNNNFMIDLGYNF